MSRRSETARQAILEATLAHLRDVGVPGLSIEGIAARAGVGKTTIYRWWPSKGVLAVDALLEKASPGRRFPAAGDDVWHDLKIVLTGIAEVMADPDIGPHLAGVLALTQIDDAAATAFRNRVLGPTRLIYHQRLTELRRRGELSADPDDILDMAFGPLWFRLLTQPDRLDPAFAESIVGVLRNSVDQHRSINVDDRLSEPT